ncbi:hypothetical protein DH2020_040502 [Rehmannia glutinosa]|uniref:ABC1 atypical kinase-like domain-containing protein n=1 Tax=Rehmannia glutinosa TaxID=99300 RepID=A0ABR0UUI5_REHGL
MATFSASFCSPTLPELIFLSPHNPTKRLKLSLNKPIDLEPRNSVKILKTRIKAVSREESVLLEEKDRELVTKLNGSVNGNVNGNYKYSNGSVENYTNGTVKVESEDENLVKYVNGNGNGNGNGSVAGRSEKVLEVVKVDNVISEKKSVEDIGQEEAWFKRSGQDQVEVSVAPGAVGADLKRGMTEEKKVQRRKVLAKWLKENILRLGPTFIKIGQQFSTRVDILAQEYVDQLSELQDQVPPFPSETAVSIVEEELGAPVDDTFERFDREPIAAASLGQVIAEYLQKIDPKSDGAKRDWVAIYDECASVLYQEIDYTKEAANAEQFAANFKDLDYVKVPTIYWEYTTPQVLTMEYVPGIKINRIQALDQLGVDRQRLGRYAVESYLEQILSHGFFHADPHPGNIAVDDFNGGRLIFYDFGMMGSISPNIREGLLEVFYGVYEKDAEKVLQAMVQMGVLVPTGDMTAVRRTAQFFLNSFEERLAAQRKEREMAREELGFKKPLSKEEMTEKKKQRLAAIGEDLLAIAADQPFRFPATFTFVVRAFSVLDGIGKGLDPRFDITEIAKPYALELLKFREAGVEDFRKRWDRQSQAVFNLFRQADRVEKLAEIIQRLEQGDLKLRVRTLESERAFQRVATVQNMVGSAVAAGSLINLATILYLNSIQMPATIAYVFCAFFSLKVLIGMVKVKKLDQRERLITGTA